MSARRSRAAPMTSRSPFSAPTESSIPKGVEVLKQSFIEMGLLKEIPDDKVMFTTAFVPVK